MISVCSTFLIPTPPHYETPHLFIIIAIEKKSNKVLIVNITSLKLGCDKSCIIDAGEHQFVKYKSVINYADATITDISILEKNIKEGLIAPDIPANPKLLQKIIRGALISDSIPEKCLNFLCSNTKISS